VKFPPGPTAVSREAGRCSEVRKERCLTYDLDYYRRVSVGLARAAELSCGETNPEKALFNITECARTSVGDEKARDRPGAINPGDPDFVISGIFFVAPTRDHMTLVVDNGFDVRLARIGINDSRPGNTVRTGVPAFLANTDDDKLFRQIIPKGRVGSSLYLPMTWGSEVIGMFNVAAMARYTFGEPDTRTGILFANLAAATWMALGGPRYLAELSATLPPWQAA
jgi:hypothetical protein